MKISRACLVSLILVVFVLFPSTSQAQIQRFDLTDEQLKEYEEALENDYSLEKPDKIWENYLSDFRGLFWQDYLIYEACKFKEPFRSLALKEIFKIEINDNAILAFIRSCWQEEIIIKAIEEFIKNSHSFFDLFELFDSADHLNFNRKYLIPIIAKMLEESSIPNYFLRKIIWDASDEQKIEIAQRILNNNPNKSDLRSISYLNIEYYTELAKLILRDKYQEEADYITDYGATIRRGVLEKIMSVNPSKQ